MLVIAGTKAVSTRIGIRKNREHATIPVIDFLNNKLIMDGRGYSEGY